VNAQYVRFIFEDLGVWRGEVLAPTELHQKREST
jgi:hypothetical protein